MHAVLGKPRRSRALYQPNARLSMRNRMQIAYDRWRQSGTAEMNFGYVLELLWKELMQCAAADEFVEENPEPWLFWKHVPETVRIEARKHTRTQ